MNIGQQLIVIETKLAGYFWENNFPIIRVVGFIIVFSFLNHILLFPGLLKTYYEFFTGIELSNYDFIGKQTTGFKEAYESINFGSENHHFKLKYRLVLPVLGKIVGLKYLCFKIFFLEFFAGIFFISQLYKFLVVHLKDAAMAFYVLCILSGTYVVSAMRMDFLGYGDSLAFLFLLLSVSRRNLLELFLYTQLAAWTDERAYVACATIVVFWWWKGKGFLEGTGKVEMKPLLIIISSLVTYCVVRLVMEEHYYTFDNNESLSVNFIDEFISVGYENVKNLGFSVWRGFKGLFFFVPLASIVLWKNMRKDLAVITLLMFMSVVSFAFIAYDLSRGLNYFYLIPVMSIFVLNKYLPKNEFKIIIVIAFIATFICPDLTFFKLTGGFSLY